MRPRRSILDLPVSSKHEVAEREPGEDLDIPDYARPGQPMTFRRWIRMVFGPSLLPGCNRPQNQALFGSWALFAVVGLFIPETILEHEWARNFCDFMASIVPQIDIVTALGMRPEVNRFHYSLVWAFAPLYLVIFYCAVDKNFAYGYMRMSRSTAVKYLLGSAGFAVVLMFAADMWRPDPESSRTLRYVYNSAVGRTIWAPLNVTATTMFTMGAIVLVLRMIAGKLNTPRRRR